MRRLLSLFLVACTASPPPAGDPPARDTDEPVDPVDTSSPDTAEPVAQVGWRVEKVVADLVLAPEGDLFGHLQRVAGLSRDSRGNDWIARTCAVDWILDGALTPVAEVVGNPCPACDFALDVTLAARRDLLALSGEGASACAGSFETVGGTGASVPGRVWLLDRSQGLIFSVDREGAQQGYVASLRFEAGQGYTFSFVVSSVYEGP